MHSAVIWLMNLLRAHQAEGLNSRSQAWLPIVSILVIIAIFLSGLFAPKGWNWALVMFFMIILFAAIGRLITGRYSGIFINKRYKMSLSRFQLVIWTLIVLSAFLTIALERINAGIPDPLAIALPTQLWALLGISTTSLVGTSLVLSTKVPKKPTKAAIEARGKLFAKEEKGLSPLDKTRLKDAVESGYRRFGILDFKLKFEDAKFSDLFTGDESGNSGLIDMAKVQKFFFTLIIAFSYMVLLANLIITAEPAGLSSFPELSDGLVALLGISSAGYLTSKAPDRTPHNGEVSADAVAASLGLQPHSS